MEILQVDGVGSGIVRNAEQIWGEISKEVETICAGIFESTNKVLKAHVAFGFTGIHENLHPRLEDILLSLNVLKSTLNGVSGAVKLDHSEQRIIDNSMQMIWCIEGVAMALKNDCLVDYETAIRMMRNQAQF